MEEDVYGEEAWNTIHKNFNHVKGKFQAFVISIVFIHFPIM